MLTNDTGIKICKKRKILSEDVMHNMTTVNNIVLYILELLRE